MRRKIPTITCDRCGRVWPSVSEQGVHTDYYGHCYHCMLTTVTKELSDMQDEADYIISTCNLCAGVAKLRVGCRQCEDTGYMIDDK